jgi:archaellum component FlaC
MNNEPIIGELKNKVGELADKIDTVLEVIGDFSTKVDECFGRIESDISGIKSDVGSMNSRLTRVESQMVTKEYLDDKLINLKADLTVVMRKEDHKHEALTNLLASKKVITDADAKSILSMEPFLQRA